MLQLVGVRRHLGGRDLLDGIDFHFSAGRRYAIYGANGAGKTTLLKILAGTDEPDAGSVAKPRDCRVGYLRQEANPDPEATVIAEVEAAHPRFAELRATIARLLARLETHYDDEKTLHRYQEAEQAFREEGGYEHTARCEALLQGLGFSEAQREASPQSLSGGWRMRVELARLLSCEPDVVVLDEPTNHLDLPSLMWFENWMLQYEGTLIFVSHDRRLLERLPEAILHLERGQLTPYIGSFSRFEAQREIEAEQRAAQWETIERKKKQLERFVERFGAKATKAKQAQSKRRVIDKLAEKQDDIPLAAAEKKIALNLPTPPANHRMVLEVKGGEIGYELPLTDPVSFQVERGQKLGVVGANGRGKSTLLKTLAGAIGALGGEWQWAKPSHVGYFAQDQQDVFRSDQNLVQNLVAETGIGEPAARRLLGQFLFSGDDAFKTFGVLSGGEKSRMGLCRLLAGPHNVLLLDEPTNHLDMPSIDLLVAALRRYQGTLLLVSHDRHLIEAVCSGLLVFSPKGDEVVAHLGVPKDWGGLA